MSFDPGAVLEDVERQTPAYSFTDNDALVSEPEMHDDASFIPKSRMLRGG
jgi:hypothetical protein